MSVIPSNGRTWCLVLAGGDGTRLHPLTQRWLGRQIPKQYCAFVGTRSMLAHTLDRAVKLSAPERVVTVIARQHDRRFLPPHPALRQGLVVRQPANRDTAAGLLLGLSYIQVFDPDADVVVLPADHFVHPDDVFVAQVGSAVKASRRVDRILLFGVRPRALELDYGWIRPGSLIRSFNGLNVFSVEGFVEKPDRDTAELVMMSGGLWSTMILVSPLDRLWAAACSGIPEVMEDFSAIVDAIGTSRETPLLDVIYDRLNPRNLSTHVLSRLGEDLATVELDNLTWSDWGTADRIVGTLRHLGRVPPFTVDGDGGDTLAVARAG